MKNEIDKAVRLAGSKEGVATLARVSLRTVDNWLATGRVNRTAARLLELETKGKLKSARLERTDKVKA